jgi:hypothetical protein
VLALAWLLGGAGGAAAGAGPAGCLGYLEIPEDKD